MKCSHHAVKPEKVWHVLERFVRAGVKDSKSQRWKSWFLLQLSLLGMPAQIFSFLLFFVSFFHLNTFDYKLLPLFCTNYHFNPGGALWFLMSFVVLFWYQAVGSFYSSWSMFCMMSSAVPFAFSFFTLTSWKHFFVVFLSWACLICTSPILS